MKIVRGKMAGAHAASVCLAAVLVISAGCSDPTGQAQLERGLLERLVAIPTVKVMPAGKALSQGGN